MLTHIHSLAQPGLSIPRYPALKACIKPVLPFMAAYHSIPFGSLIVFFGLYLGMANNKYLSRFVRFNAMQVSRGPVASSGGSRDG